MEKEFKIGDTVEATWCDGSHSTHVITRMETDSPWGNLYRFNDTDGYEIGLHGKYLRLVSCCG